MKCYQIKNTLTDCPPEMIKETGVPYVVVMNSAEWKETSESFDMMIDLDLDTANVKETKAVVNYDSLTGSFLIPNRNDITGPRHSFVFALDEKGIVLIDDEKYAGDIVSAIQRTKRWKLPSLERFLYDFLEKIIEKDLSLLESVEHRLNREEQRILEENLDTYPAQLNDIRGDLLDLRVHYEQLIDFGQELEENENGYFSAENLRFFRLFTERVVRLEDTVTSLREYIVQLRDLVQSQTETKQNKIMTVLTVVTSIFMPLTLIAGWYGMNFRYMPELDERMAYPIVILISLLIAVGGLMWFRKNKWL